ncbi:NAD(P)-binding protein [Aureobasidium pullulans]|nr:NAD(P)-binding protein [Aureobasidium pullulans]THY06628.1 NAD(P)-binding protein [Aureobasidium pullulans]THZ19248.1 NAD(P)-binding protein [Aureobasidium pullulans]
MAPIGVGIIGLSAAGGSWGVSAHLPYLKDSTKYKITGVCNSSTESSQKAIDTYGFSADAKAYGSVAEMAASSDIDLVVCAVRVDRHYEAMKPALEAGKDCFVEWPLASNVEQATELLQIAERKGVKTMIGLQGQMSPVISRIKDIIEKDKAIGRITGSHVSLAGMLGGKETIEPMEYLNYAETGGNMLVIPFGHLYDSISYTLGELQEVSSTLSIQHPDVVVKSADGSKVVKTIRRTAADHISMSGLLSNGAQSSAVVYGGQAFPGEPSFLWRIEGEKGVIQVRGDQPFALSMSLDMNVQMQLLETGDVKDIEFTEDKPGPPGNVGRLYEAFADGQYYPDWKWAVKRHAWVDALYKSNETGKRVSYV